MRNKNKRVIAPGSPPPPPKKKKKKEKKEKYIYNDKN